MQQVPCNSNDCPTKLTGVRPTDRSIDVISGPCAKHQLKRDEKKKEDEEDESKSKRQRNKAGLGGKNSSIERRSDQKA